MKDVDKKSVLDDLTADAADMGAYDHKCGLVCFSGLASEHVTRYGFMPKLDDLYR